MISMLSRDAGFLAPLHDCAVHEINFSLALGEHVLQHRGAVLAGGIRSFLHQGPRIAVQFDTECLGDGLAFGNQIVE
jgi:hypothetical protein